MIMWDIQVLQWGKLPQVWRDCPRERIATEIQKVLQGEQISKLWRYFTGQIIVAQVQAQQALTIPQLFWYASTEIVSC